MKQLLISIDQALNVLVYINGDGFGMADETLSARAWRLRAKSRVYRIIDTIFFFDKEGEKRHCQLSYESELSRKHLPKEYQ